MNRYILIRRLRAPAILLLIGVIALLHQMDVIDDFWRYLVPLILILLGILLLAERAVLAMDGDPGPGYPGSPYPGSPYPGSPYPGAPFPGAPYPGSPAPQQSAAPESTSIVPSHSHDFGDGSNGGQQ
jgi:hypothetical protein